MNRFRAGLVRKKGVEERTGGLGIKKASVGWRDRGRRKKKGFLPGHLSFFIGVRKCL